MGRPMRPIPTKPTLDSVGMKSPQVQIPDTGLKCTVHYIIVRRDAIASSRIRRNRNHIMARRPDIGKVCKTHY